MTKAGLGLLRHGDPDQAENQKRSEQSKDQRVDQRGVVQPKGRPPGGQAAAGIEAADTRRVAALQPIEQSQVNGSALRWVRIA